MEQSERHERIEVAILEDADEGLVGAGGAGGGRGKRGRGGRKTRAFRAWLLGLVEADFAWDAGEARTGVVRPVWAAFGASEMEAAAFEANLRDGRPCVSSRGSTRYEFLRSAGYMWTRQRAPGGEGVVLTAHHPGVFCHDPGYLADDPVAGVRFCAMPSLAWSRALREAMARHDAGIRARAVEHCDRLGLLETDLEATCRTNPPRFDWYTSERDRAARIAQHRLEPAEHRENFRRAFDDAIPSLLLAVSMLDRRVRAPIPSDVRFQLQLALALHRLPMTGRPQRTALMSRLAAWLMHQSDDAMSTHGTGALGFSPPVAFALKAADFEKVLVEELARYREATARERRSMRTTREARAVVPEAKGAA